MAQSRQSETQRSGGGASGKNRDQERSGKSGQEMGNRQRTGGDGSASTSGGKDKDMMSQAQDQAGTMVEQARQQAASQLSSQKTRAASTLGTLAGALHEASRQVREQDDDAMMAGYIDTAASQVDRLADTVKQQDLGQIIDSTGRFARQQPAVFLAAAIAVGFAGARFLKSSSQPSHQGRGSSGYGEYRGQSGAYGRDFSSGYAATGMGMGMGMERTSGYGASPSGTDTGGGYGSAMSGNAAADFAETAGSESGTRGDWQARSGFQAGREGQ